MPYVPPGAPLGFATEASAQANCRSKREARPPLAGRPTRSPVGFKRKPPRNRTVVSTYPKCEPVMTPCRPDSRAGVRGRPQRPSSFPSASRRHLPASHRAHLGRSWGRSQAAAPQWAAEVTIMVSMDGLTVAMLCVCLFTELCELGLTGRSCRCEVVAAHGQLGVAEQPQTASSNNLFVRVLRVWRPRHARATTCGRLSPPDCRGAAKVTCAASQRADIARGAVLLASNVNHAVDAPPAALVS